MFFDRIVLLNISPDHLHTEIYDIANIFYNGAIKRCARVCGADSLSDAGTRRADLYGDGAGAVAVVCDCIFVAYAENHCEIVICFGASGLCAPGGGCLTPDGRGCLAPDDGVCLAPDSRDCPRGRQVRIHPDMRLTDGKPISYPIKMALYHALKEQAMVESKSWRSLPWGALVGVRPIKLYADLIGRGMPWPAIADEMARTYDVPKKTSELCARIATTQIPTLRAYDPDRDCMLYIGVPFCASKCAYCSFPSDAHNKVDLYASRYLDALLGEIRYIADYIKDVGKSVKVLYIGGGTPTALGARDLEKLLTGVRDVLRGSRPDEITVEAGRADTIDREKLELIYEAARPAERLRLCINPQTMNARTLRLIARNHTPKEVEEAFWLAREVGFDNINMDIIAGLPGEGINDFIYTLDAIARLRPENITSHTLCIKRSSRFNEHGEEYGYPSAETAEAMQDAAYTYASGMGMAPYYLYRQKNTIGHLANIGYAQKGRECIYNIHEMADQIDIFAAGAGAVSKFVNAATGRVERVFNVKNLLEYISRSHEMIDRKRSFFASERNNCQ